MFWLLIWTILWAAILFAVGVLVGELARRASDERGLTDRLLGKDEKRSASIAPPGSDMRGVDAPSPAARPLEREPVPAARREASEPSPQPVAAPKAPSAERSLGTAQAETSRMTPTVEEPAVVDADGSDEVAPERLSAPRNGVPDDLTRIRGIGKRNEERLHALGIYHYEQIAGWKWEHQKWVESHLAFPGRISREKWVDQARALAGKGGSDSTAGTSGISLS